MSNPEVIKSPQKPRRSRRVTAAVVAGALVAGALVADKLGVIDISTSTKTEIAKPDITIRKIKPIDIGCFVEVDANIKLQADEHKRVGIGIAGFDVAHKDVWTNTTKSDNDGIGRLCVDNTGTEVTLTTDASKKTKVLDVNIGSLYTEGFIMHNGHDGAKTNRAFGQRFGELFGGDGNQNIKAGLDLIAQTLFAQTPCVGDALPIAETGIRKHYTDLAKTLSEGSITSVNINYGSVPTEGNMPTGKINKALENMGVSVPDNWGIKAEAPLCSVVQIDGRPGVANISQ